MKRRFHGTPDWRKTNLDATSAGPIVKLALAALGLLAAVLLTVFVLVPYLTGWLKSGLRYPWSEPTPVPSAAPTPVINALTVNRPEEIAYPGVIVDPTVWNGTLLFATGEDGARCDQLVAYNLSDGAYARIETISQYECLRMPVQNDQYLLYLDGNTAGGGSIRVIDRSTGRDSVLTEYAFGVPKLFLEANYLTFTERASETRFRLNVTDLATKESATVAVFEYSEYAASAPSLASGQILYADADPADASKSVIRSLHIATDGRWAYDAGTYVHDPKSNGDSWVWMSGNHSVDSDLYLATHGGRPACIARGVADFGLTGQVVVFCRDESIYAYRIDEDKTYVLSDTGAHAQLLYTGGGYAVWRDVTDPEQPVYRAMKVE